MSSCVSLNKEFLFKEFCDALTTFASTNISISSFLFENIINAYSSKDRFYHDLRHVQYSIETLNVNKCRDKSIARNHLKLAIFYHDFFYDVTRKDNELQSAAYAYKQLKIFGVKDVDCDFISSMILATKPNIHFNDENLTDDMSANFSMIRDIDLASFSVVDFQFFEQDSLNIYNEYKNIVSYEDFVQKRCAFLKSYQNRLVYYTNIIHSNREKIAHKNFDRYIKENIQI